LSFAQFEAEWRSVPLERMRSSCGICTAIVERTKLSVLKPEKIIFSYFSYASLIFPLNPSFMIYGGAFRPHIVKVGALSAPTQEMLLKYCLDLSYIQNGSYLFLLFIKT
ncbi:hypothetical protein PMN51_15510, partial [Blautia wexlerae]|nr:hypothetical protein [Blautia wexlerae]